ncbi:MAG: ADP-heptose--LPS heptosyltransferase [Phycisphaerae bacterium]
MSESDKKKIVFKCSQAPGDIVMVTAMLRDLHRAYPSKFLTDVRTRHDELFYNNPYLTRLDEDKADIVLELENSFISLSRGPYHYIHSFIFEVNRALELNIKPTEFKGDLYLSAHEKSLEAFNEDEREIISQVKNFAGDVPDYWVICAGGKSDFTTKIWSLRKWQAVVNHFKGKLNFVQIGRLCDCHPQLENTLNLVGRTPSLRGLMKLIYHSQGTCCGVSLPIHLSAALPKADGSNRPCVVVAGGIEPPNWDAYPSHRFLSTAGCLPCCGRGACWSRHVVKPLIPDKYSADDNYLCRFPVIKKDSIPQPLCLEIIQPQDVIRSIELYLEFKHRQEISGERISKI